jgi:dihydroflavonol-4-reductase
VTPRARRREPAEAAGPVLAAGDRVLVTGAAGFIGSAITRAALARGARVVAAVEPGGDDANLAGVDVERVAVDVRDGEGVAAAVAGCRVVFHTAARYGFWARDPGVFYDVNVGGTRNVMGAAARSGCERVVYTSTVGVLGLDAAEHGVAVDEDSPARVAHLFGPYKQSKYVAEHEVLRHAAQGLPVTLVLPTFPLGPRDRRPTPTGKVVLDFLNGRMPGFVDTSLNVVHVDDLAEAHLLALERGRAGRSYIAGGENLSMDRILGTIAEVTGLPPSFRRVPTALALGAAHASEYVEGRLLRREPAVPLEAARMSTTNMLFDDSRARRELGYTSRPAVEAIESSARWYVDNGYVRPTRHARIRWATSPATPPERVGVSG